MLLLVCNIAIQFFQR